MKKFFTDKVIIITGSSMGIGKALAEIVGRNHAKIVLNARNLDVLASTEKELRNSGYEVISLAGDITKEDDRRKLIEFTLARFGKIDVLVNNAGTSMRGNIEELSSELITSIFEVNTLGPLSLSRLAIPHLKKTKGSVVFISSLAGLKGLPLISVYSSAKMALTAIAESMRVELASDQVHVGIYYVGYTEVEKGKAALGPRGEKIALGERKGMMVSATNDVAKTIAGLIKRRSNKSVLGAAGKVYHVLALYFPRLVELLLINSYKRMKKVYK